MLAAVAAVMPALAASAGEDQWQLDRREARWPVESAETIEIHNPWGDIYLRTHDREQLYLLTHTQRHGSDPRQALVDLQRRDEVLTITTRFDDQPQAKADDWDRRRTDATVFVPSGKAVNCSTTHGRIEARGLWSPVSVRSDTGDISLRVAGPIQARSKHGAISVFFLSTDWARPSTLETVTGPIETIMPHGTSARVKLETHGWITTDFSVDIERAKDDDFKTATADIGEGGGSIVIKSSRGSIRLLDSRIPPQQRKTND